jgi:predicted metal-dependent phosphoesterase TrpH
MLTLVQSAGGVSVVAHPWARMSRRVLTAAAFADLAAGGLAGIEVEHPDHDADTRRRLRAIAAELDLVVTGSSDHHGDGKGRAFELGSNTTAPGQLDRLMSLARAASSRSGRDTPVAVLP